MIKIGVSVDRRAIAQLTRVYNSACVEQVVRFVCAQTKTRIVEEQNNASNTQYGIVNDGSSGDIVHYAARRLAVMQNANKDVIDMNLSFATYEMRRAADHCENGLGEASTTFAEMDPDNWDWKREFIMDNNQTIPLVLSRRYTEQRSM